MNNLNENSSMTSFSEEPKKGKKFLPIIIILAVVLAAGVAVFAAKDKLTNIVKEKTTSPVDYYHSVEKDNFNEDLNAYMDTYKKTYDYITSGTVGGNASIKVELADDISTMISGMVPQLAGLKSAEIAFGAGIAKDALTFDLGAKINDTDLISGNMYFDTATPSLYAQVPAISDSYLDFSSALANVDFTEFTAVFASINDMYAAMYPEADTMKKWAETYFNLIVDSTKTVEKKDVTVTANGIEQKAVALTVTMSGEDVYNMIYKLLETLEKDESLHKYITDYMSTLESMSQYGEYTGITADELVSALTEAKTSLEASKDEFTQYTKPVVMVVYVNDEGNIIGREITINDATVDDTEGTETIIITSKKAISGKDMGYELDVVYNDETYFTIDGKGSASLSDFAGEFVATIPSESISITAKIDNCDVSKYLAGELKCDVTLTTNYEMLSGYELKLSLDSSLMEYTFKVEAGGSDINFGAITIAGAASEELSVKKPDTSNLVDISDETALMTYIGSFDPETYVNNFTTAAGLNITYSDLITLFSSLSDSNSYEDDYSYDEDYSFDEDYTWDEDYTSDEDFSWEDEDYTSDEDFSWEDEDYTSDEDFSWEDEDYTSDEDFSWEDEDYTSDEEINLDDLWSEYDLSESEY